MTPEKQFTDFRLDEAVTEIRNDVPDPALVEAAAARVWSRLTGEADRKSVV